MEDQIFHRQDREIANGYEVTSDILCLPLLIVNVCLVGYPAVHSTNWVLVDTGLSNSSETIIEIAEERFGKGTKPAAIILTHGHFDHVGAVKELAEHWDVQVYAHELELPFLTGQANYPPPDPMVGGGLMARIAPLYPHNSINLGKRIRKLPDSGTIPAMPDWRWIHAPGHTPGQVCLFRDEDRVLIAGDAFTTVKQESALAVLTQKQEVHGPPAYFTTNWHQAWDSVKRIDALKPDLVISGHGIPMSGDALQQQLDELVQNFDQLAIPPHGRYVH